MGKGKDLKTSEKSKIKVIELENVHFIDIKGALQRSLNDKEGC